MGLTAKVGMVYDDAYVRIHEIVTHRAHPAFEDSANYHSITVHFYADENAFLAGATPVKVDCVRLDYDPNATVSMATLYTWLEAELSA